jgi:hypothetical protein
VRAVKGDGKMDESIETIKGLITMAFRYAEAEKMVAKLEGECIAYRKQIFELGIKVRELRALADKEGNFRTGADDNR